MIPSLPEPVGRAGLLAAAHAELAEHGRSAISLRAVARRAGVSHAAPKYHFADRAAIGILSSTVDRLVAPTRAPGAAAEAPSALALSSWALVHGLVVLTRDGALGEIAGLTDPAAAAAMAHALLLTSSTAEALGQATEQATHG